MTKPQFKQGDLETGHYSEGSEDTKVHRVCDDTSEIVFTGLFIRADFLI